MTTYTIERLGQRGDGIAAGPVFVPLALPGEVVSGSRHGDMLDDVRIEVPSPDRVSAPCSHFRSCGGCQMQHASDELVARWKQAQVADALAAHGIAADVRPTLTSPARSRIRATFSARRTKKGAMAGFHARRSDAIIPVPHCTLVEPALMPGLAAAEALATMAASRKGELSVTVTDSLAGLDVFVTGGKPLDGPLRVTLAEVAQAQALARLTWDDEVVAMRHAPVQRMGTAQVVPPPGAFLQATRHGQQALTETVQQIVGDAARVVDLFAGCGTFALPLAATAEVHAVEGDKAMIDALDRAWRDTPNLKRVTSEARDLFRRPLLPDELAKVDAAVIDPPRAGAAAQIAELAQAQVPVIAHVSCNPATFARDAATLIGAGYSLDFVQPVDQFRWSTHVELVGAFRLSHITR
ncbi:class I SAM-dependent RNA methyltransferase [uncultured Tateyamaria sp.]|uniref:class I SAM-dependent RNA methyltransferase n=1 Tax=Tateyamaria sp. 1078 TaxID=3417464 RepID=UPI002630607F|nr:class I SAM-dependent RNA methyltransferase [uncultured Tateyamaria sp.]